MARLGAPGAPGVVAVNQRLGSDQAVTLHAASRNVLLRDSLPGYPSIPTSQRALVRTLRRPAAIVPPLPGCSFLFCMADLCDFGPFAGVQQSGVGSRTVQGLLRFFAMKLRAFPCVMGDAPQAEIARAVSTPFRPWHDVREFEPSRLVAAVAIRAHERASPLISPPDLATQRRRNPAGSPHRAELSCVGLFGGADLALLQL